MTLDDVIRLERKDEREKVTEEVTKQVTEEVTKQVTEEVSKEKDIEFCKKMLSKNMSLEEIKDWTKLSEEEILEIQKQM